MVNGIKTNNIKPMIRERIKQFTERLKECPEVEGIVYLGGLANTNYKDFIDKFSDIDIGIFLNTDKENLPDWLQPFSFYIPVTEEGEERMMEVNLHQQILSEEKQSEWANTKKEAYAYASEVVFDRNSQIEEMIKDKTKLTEEYKKKYLSHLLSRINWNVRINPLRAIERGLLINGEELLNQGLENMLDLLFVYNSKYPPHAKWKVSMIESLDYYPKDIMTRIEECFKIEEISEQDILNRRTNILEIVKEIEERVKKDGIFEKDEDYSEFEYKHWTPKKQLKEETKYDEIISKVPNLPSRDKKVLMGLLCEFFLNDLEEIYDIPKENLCETYKKVLEKVIYYDPKTKQLISDYVKAKKNNDYNNMKNIIRQLKRRQIELVFDKKGNVDIKKIKYSKYKDGENEYGLD